MFKENTFQTFYFSFMDTGGLKYPYFKNLQIFLVEFKINFTKNISIKLNICCFRLKMIRINRMVLHSNLSTALLFCFISHSHVYSYLYCYLISFAVFYLLISFICF